MHYVIYIVPYRSCTRSKSLGPYSVYNATRILLGEFLFLYQVTTDLGNRGDTRLELIQKIIM